jgi:hypothetical protein
MRGKREGRNLLVAIKIYNFSRLLSLELIRRGILKFLLYRRLSLLGRRSGRVDGLLLLVVVGD